MENESAIYFYHLQAVKFFGLMCPSLLGPRFHLAYYFGTHLLWLTGMTPPIPIFKSV
jgi:hypothetical protein